MSAFHQLFSAREAGIFSFPKKEKTDSHEGNQSFFYFNYS